MLFWKIVNWTSLNDYDFTPSRMAVTQHTNRKWQTLVRMWRTCALLVGMQNGVSTMENYGVSLKY